MQEQPPPESTMTDQGIDSLTGMTLDQMKKLKKADLVCNVRKREIWPTDNEGKERLEKSVKKSELANILYNYIQDMLESDSEKADTSLYQSCLEIVDEDDEEEGEGESQNETVSLTRSNTQRNVALENGSSRNLKSSLKNSQLKNV